MSTELFKIKPLEWVEKKAGDGHESFQAEVPMGRYLVEPRNPWTDDDSQERDLQLQMKWSFDEYYDEGDQVCESVEHGKQLAEDDWRRRLSPALESAELPEPEPELVEALEMCCGLRAQGDPETIRVLQRARAVLAKHRKGGPQ